MSIFCSVDVKISSSLKQSHRYVRVYSYLESSYYYLQKQSEQQVSCR